jgi:hypothetical protein
VHGDRRFFRGDNVCRWCIVGSVGFKEGADGLSSQVTGRVPRIYFLHTIGINTDIILFNLVVNLSARGGSGIVGSRRYGSLGRISFGFVRILYLRRVMTYFFTFFVCMSKYLFLWLCTLAHVPANISCLLARMRKKIPNHGRSDALTMASEKYN